MHRNQSVSAHSFAMVPRADIPRSRFNVQASHKTTLDAGKLIPIYVDEWECILSAVEAYCLQLSKDGEHDYLKAMQEAQNKLLAELGMIET